MKYYPKYMLICIVSLMSTAALAQEASCERYLRLLSDRSLSRDIGCSEISRALTANRNLSARGFLTRYGQNFPEGSGLQLLIISIDEFYGSNHLLAYEILEIADSRLFHNFTRHGDIERAELYSYAVTVLRLSITEEVFGVDLRARSFNFERTIRNYPWFTPQFGSEISNFEELAYCLVRFDNFSIDLLDLLTSSAFETCLER